MTIPTSDNGPDNGASLRDRAVVNGAVPSPPLRASVPSAWRKADDLPDEEVPVIAEYRSWGLSSGEKRTHTVWVVDGQWRCYPDTDGLAYVDRWRFKKPAQGMSARQGQDRHGLGGATRQPGRLRCAPLQPGVTP